MMKNAQTTTLSETTSTTKIPTKSEAVATAMQDVIIGVNAKKVLADITANKETIKELRNKNIDNYKTVIVLIKEDIAELQKLPIYATANKKVLVTYLKKFKYDNKDGIINTVLNIMELGLNIDNNATNANLVQTLKYFYKGRLTKTFINKATLEKLTEKLTALRKEDKLSI